MKLSKHKDKFPANVYSHLLGRIEELRPGQLKAVNAGLFEGKNLLICTPTASGKTLIAEMAFLNSVAKGKTLYVVPLRALASEKYTDFKKLYELHDYKIAVSSGDLDKSDTYLENYDLIITTSEKLDSLLRHKINWINNVKTVVIDEVHLLNDVSRGPTLEIVITLLRQIIPKAQIICLSATVGNAFDLASWLNAELVKDEWRPVELHKGVYLDGEVEFFISKVKKK
jgi:helicase